MCSLKISTKRNPIKQPNFIYFGRYDHSSGSISSKNTCSSSTLKLRTNKRCAGRVQDTVEIIFLKQNYSITVDFNYFLCNLTTTYMKYAKGTVRGYLIEIKLKWPQNFFLKTAHEGIKYLVKSSELILCGLSAFAKRKHFKKILALWDCLLSKH